METSLRSLRSFAANLILVAAAAEALCAQSADLQVRPKNFIVTPSTGPVAEIIVKNNDAALWSGTVTPTYPEGWQVAPTSQQVDLAVGESKVLSFVIEKGLDRKANVYPVSVAADGTDPVQTDVVCASTPYYKPEIDGKLDEWADAIPVTFMTGGKKTTVRSYWNKSQFCLAVEVEEDALIGLKDASAENGVDAIQLALSPGKSQTAAIDAVRYEYVATASGSWIKGDRCFQLIKSGDSLAGTQEAKELEPLLLEEAEVEVKRADGITRYELAVPMKSMRTLRATAGREYCFSLLVHDPDGSGVRDLGTVMNLNEAARTPQAWSNWEYAKWNGTVPLDNKVEFGFCSSIH